VKTALLVLAVTAIAVGGINFLWFIAESDALRGDAVNGYVANGLYFVCAHGSCHEVARETWEWSRLHALSLVVTHPLAMIAMAFVLFRYGFPMFMGTRLSESTARVSSVEASGPRLMAMRCGGIVGEVNFTSPLLGVAVFPAGVVIRPILMSPVVVLGSEIRKTTATRRFLASRFEIEHAAVDAPSPIVLYLRQQSVLARAISSVAKGASEAPSTSLAPAPAQRQDPLRRPFIRITAISNIVIGAGLAIFGATQLGTTGVFGVVLVLVAALFIATGVWRMLRTR